MSVLNHSRYNNIDIRQRLNKLSQINGCTRTLCTRYSEALTRYYRKCNRLPDVQLLNKNTIDSFRIFSPSNSLAHSLLHSPISDFSSKSPSAEGTLFLPGLLLSKAFLDTQNAYVSVFIGSDCISFPTYSDARATFRVKISTCRGVRE